MKKIIALLICLLIGPSVFGQKTPVSYVSKRKHIDTIGKSLLEKYFSDWDDRVCEITLKTDSIFVFRVKPSTTSCLTWRDYEGTWKRVNDTIIFYDQYEVMENDAQYIYSNKKQNKYYLLKFKTDKGMELISKDVNIQFEYDFDSALEDIELKMEFEGLEMELDNNFSLKIPFKDIPNHNELASIRYEYSLPNGEIRAGYITEFKIVNKKVKDIPNCITIVLIEQPKKETIYRTTKAVLEKNGIRIISKNKTKSDLPDYTKEIKFNEYYEKL